MLQKKGLLTPRSVVVRVRDDDGHPERREQANDARSLLPASTPLLLAIATECGEAWVIAGWRPPAGEPKLKVWRKSLGFEPQAQPSRLSHSPNVPKSAKMVLKDLFEGDDAKEASALIEAAESASQASRESGLHAFCTEIDEWLKRA